MAAEWSLPGEQWVFHCRHSGLGQVQTAGFSGVKCGAESDRIKQQAGMREVVVLAVIAGRGERRYVVLREELICMRDRVRDPGPLCEKQCERQESGMDKLCGRGRCWQEFHSGRRHGRGDADMQPSCNIIAPSLRTCIGSWLLQLRVPRDAYLNFMHGHAARKATRELRFLQFIPVALAFRSRSSLVI